MQHRIWKVTGWGLGYATIMALPGAVLGFITGRFGAHNVAAVAAGVAFFLLYPAWRRARGPGPDATTYFLAFCGAAGAGVACYLVGTYTA